MRNTRAPILFSLICLVVLFMPGVGDLRWVGFIGFLYAGIPWYILAVKDVVEERLAVDNSTRQLRIHSIALLVIGLLSLLTGVSIDLFIMYQIYSDPSHTTFWQGLLRLLVGIPFFGFGAYLFYLSLGISNNET